jgi:hypothetical protein
MRTLERTHGWILFRCDLAKAGAALWLALGEAASKCEHISRVPLRPATAQALHQLPCSTALLHWSGHWLQHATIRLNKTRADFAEKSEELIESYHTGSRDIGDVFEELVKLCRNPSEEQQRHVRENMTGEELVIFEFLTRPVPEPGAEKRAEVKKVARELLDRLKQLLARLRLRPKTTRPKTQDARQRNLT